MKRLRRLLCRVFGHREADSVLTYSVRVGEGPWRRVRDDGPPVCGRCDAILGAVEVETAGGFNVTIDNVSLGRGWA